MTNAIKRGEIYYIDNPEPSKKAKNVQGGIRPAVIISNDVGNLHSPVVVVAYLTTKNKKQMPTHTTTFGTGKQSIVLLEQPTTISKGQILGNCIGKLSDSEIKEMDKALRISLGLNGGKTKNEENCMSFLRSPFVRFKR